MDLKASIQNDMKTAMKAQESDKVSVLRMLVAEIKKREIDKRSPLDEGEIQKAIQTMIKQRHDSVEAFTKGAREDLAAKEKAEIEILKAYLPAQMSREELEKIVVQVLSELGPLGPNDVGKAMKPVLAKVAGKADGKLVNEVVRQQLTKS